MNRSSFLRVLILSLIFTSILNLSACVLLNEVKPLASGATVSQAATLVMIGVGTEVRVRPENGTLSLSEYELADQTIKGNCLRYNHISISMLDIPPSGIHYYLFSAPKGHYVLNGFNAPKLNSPLNVVEVQEGRVNYVADFLFQTNDTVQVLNRTQAAREALATQWPKVAQEFTVAQRSKGNPGALFLCAP